MNIWSVPPAALAGLVGIVCYLGMAATRVRSVVHNLIEYLVEKAGSGVSSASRGQARGSLTPGWVNPLGWSTIVVAFALMVYLGLRFGPLWALGLAVLDYILKSFDFPMLPTVDQTYGLVLKKARSTAPRLAEQLEAHRPDYQHK
ncbi:MAG: hypothetical protein AB7S38_00640 [Vulcanimicrobiota bacterium]